ncbi:MAG: DUF2809 domain-containing protein [Bacteroides xylanisolvens]
MKKRFFYIISFLLIFCIEVLIALYVRDNFIRPYVGDMLVVVLGVGASGRIFLLTGIPADVVLCLFACLFVEAPQYFRLVETLVDHEPRAARIILGLSRSIGRHSLLYAVGCVSIVLFERHWQELPAMRRRFFVFLFNRFECAFFSRARAVLRSCLHY